jgi:hypothetical protein
MIRTMKVWAAVLVLLPVCLGLRMAMLASQVLLWCMVGVLYVLRGSVVPNGGS